MSYMVFCTHIEYSLYYFFNRTIAILIIIPYIMELGKSTWNLFEMYCI